MQHQKGLPPFWVQHLFPGRTLSYTEEQPSFEPIAVLAHNDAQADCSHLSSLKGVAASAKAAYREILLRPRQHGVSCKR